jgi:hypothetical protein
MGMVLGETNAAEEQERKQYRIFHNFHNPWFYQKYGFVSSPEVRS